MCPGRWVGFAAQGQWTADSSQQWDDVCGTREKARLGGAGRGMADGNLGKEKKQATDDKVFQLKKMVADLLSAKTPPLFSQLLAPSELSNTQQ